VGGAATIGVVDITRSLFIDETWVKTNMSALRGWSSKGKKLYGQARFGH